MALTKVWHWSKPNVIKSSAEKYANAIERLQNTDLPTAKVAAEFGLNPETFRMYLREHHPELVTARGMIRTSDGKVVSNRSAESMRRRYASMQPLPSP